MRPSSSSPRGSASATRPSRADREPGGHLRQPREVRCAERESPTPAPDPHQLGAILRRVTGKGGLTSLNDRKVNAVIQAVEEFDAVLPAEVHRAAQAFELARRRQAEVRDTKPGDFGADDLLADDWEDRLGRVLDQNLRHDRNAWERVVAAAVSQTGANLKRAVLAALPGVVAQAEQWLRDNQRDLARYSNGGGDVTPIESVTWRGWDQAVRRFAERLADFGGGGRVAELPYAAQVWALLWD